MKGNLFLFLKLFAFNCVFAQYSATIMVLDVSNSQVVVGAQVKLNSITLTTGDDGLVVFNDLSGSTVYTLTIKKSCYEDFNDNFVVGELDVFRNVYLNPKTANDVNISLTSSSTNIAGFSINLTSGGAYNETISSGNPLGDHFSAVPYGVYAYTITQNCYETISGQITIDCNIDQAIELAIIPNKIGVDNSVTQLGDILTANASGMTYQWIDCNNNNSPIEGATSQIFTVAAIGNYAVIITNPTCSTTVTSRCIPIITLSVENEIGDAFSVYPNPALNDLVILLNSDYQSVSVEIVNMQGQIVLKGNYIGNNNVNLNISTLSSGLYIINLKSDRVFSSKRIIKN